MFIVIPYPFKIATLDYLHIFQTGGIFQLKHFCAGGGEWRGADSSPAGEAPSGP